MALVIAIRINIRSRKRFILYFLCQLEHPASLSVAASGTPHHCSDVPLKYRRGTTKPEYWILLCVLPQYYDDVLWYESGWYVFWPGILACIVMSR